jgi:hypothetical protein
MLPKINEINFVEQIRDLDITYQSIIKAKNFLDDNRSQFRHAVKEIDNDESIYHAISDSVKEAEKNLLISCYTIAEQMLKETKYQLLDFDRYNESRLQKFLNYKLEPEKFSPNPKHAEINKFFKRYASSKLFLNELKLYDEMIDCRHRYAHKGEFRFDINNIPKLIDILLYLEFEYRMFLTEDSWCIFLIKINEIISEPGGRIAKQEKFKAIEGELKSLIPNILTTLSCSKNIVCEVKDILVELKDEDEFVNFENKLNAVKNSIKSKISK